MQNGLHFLVVFACCSALSSTVSVGNLVLILFLGRECWDIWLQYPQLCLYLQHTECNFISCWGWSCNPYSWGRFMWFQLFGGKSKNTPHMRKGYLRRVLILLRSLELNGLEHPKMLRNWNNNTLYFQAVMLIFEYSQIPISVSWLILWFIFLFKW